MNQPTAPASTHGSNQLHNALHPQPIMLRAGGGLGIAGCSIGLMVFLFTCFGFGFALAFSFLPLVMGGVGFVLSIIGGFDKHAEGSNVAAALFINVAAIAGGALTFWAWQHWPKSV